MMISCTRMYNLDSHVTDLWRQLLNRAAEVSGVALEVIDYPAPAPLPDLWSRPDMGAVFMCGWPFRRAQVEPQIVAAPIPAGGPCDGPFYCTDMVVRADSAFQTIEDTFGGRIAWTEAGSHSGFNAPRHLLLPHVNEGKPLYSGRVGPVITPRASLNSVLDGDADVAPLDSFFHALLRKHEPETAAKVRVVAQSACAPIPLLVAAPQADSAAVAALGDALAAADTDEIMARLLPELCLDGFARVDAARYALTEEWDTAARAAGYPDPA